MEETPMKKIIYKNSVETVTDIVPKPINLEQYCEIEGYYLRVYYDPMIPKRSWKVDLCGHGEWINSGYGSTQLKAMSNLVDEINKAEVFPLPVTLGRKGWIKRS